MDTCARCGKGFDAHPDAGRFDHYVCEDCRPIVASEWAERMHDPSVPRLTIMQPFGDPT